MNKSIFFVFVALFLSACSNTSLENKVEFKKIQEKLEFNIVDESKALEQVDGFLKKIKAKNKKTDIVISYKIDKSFFVDKVSRSLKSKMFDMNAVKKIVTDADTQKDILISAIYFVVADKKCGILEISSAAQYKFGCSSEYNRALSILNAPVK